MIDGSPAAHLTRRRLLAGLALGAVCAVRSRPAQAQQGAPSRVLRARPATLRLLGADKPESGVLAFDDAVPGPILRFRRGDDIAIRFLNDGPEPAAIHWHGVRVPNAMDGLSGLTQPEVSNGASFDYYFRARDAGTFFYRASMHTHNVKSQFLSGALVIEEFEPDGVDRDVILLLDDWPISNDGSLQDSARGLIVANGATASSIPVTTNERIRLRLINASRATPMRLQIEGHAPRVMAIDGQPAQPFLARDASVALGPGNRIDLLVDVTLAAGAQAAITCVAPDRTLAAIAHFDCQDRPPIRPSPLTDPAPFPANALPDKINLQSSLKVEINLGGEFVSASPPWDRAPAFSVARGRPVTLALANRTDADYAVHLHGHSVRLLDKLDDGWKPFWLDSLMIAKGATERVAFLADNPGKWLIECQPLNQPAGLRTAWFQVG